MTARDYIADYEGYDDVYGHSVEEDYGVSPSTGMYVQLGPDWAQFH